MDDLPNDLYFKILTEVSYETLLKLCQLDIKFSNLCEEDTLWRDRIELEFGEKLLNLKPTTLTYKKQYAILYKTVYFLQNMNYDKLISLLSNYT